MLSKPLGDFVWINYAILDFVETDNVALFLPVKISATYVIYRYRPESDFTCVNHLDWEFNFVTKIIVNIFFSNKQRMSKDIVRKESVTGFKKRERTK